MRLVLDLNVFVSAVLAHGAPAKLFDRWRRDAAYELVVCPQLLAELEAVLRRDRLARHLTPGDAGALLTVLRDRATRPDPVDPAAVVRDRDDDYIVALAVETEADAVVSGDRDLLEIKDPPTAVWSPAQALEHLPLS